MRRTLLALFAALLMLSSSMAAEITQEPVSYSNDFDTARSLANFMEDHYSVSILIGDECEGIITEGFELGDKPSGRTPLLNMLGTANYEEEVKRIDDCFFVYPPGFFDHFHCQEAEKGLRILLPNSILVDGHTMAGVTTVQDGYYNVFLGVGAYNSLNVHHEIWHAMEYRITSDNPGAFVDWNSLNPDGFQYNEDYFLNDIWTQAEAKDDWFVRGYSVVNEMEDRATVIEAIFLYDSDWWDQHPHIQAKRDRLLAAAESVFGNVYFHE